MVFIPALGATDQATTPLLVHLVLDADYGLFADARAGVSGGFVQALLDQTDIGYLGLAGGDTSSCIASRLGIQALDFSSDLGSGSCVCAARHADPRRDRMRVMLKGGQMGSPDLFDRFALIR